MDFKTIVFWTDKPFSLHSLYYSLQVFALKH